MNYSDSRRDIIANYLFKKFIRQEDCPMPPEIHNSFINLAKFVLKQPDFEQKDPSEQEEILSAGVDAIFGLLGVTCCDESVLKELSSKLEDVFMGRSQTFRPLVDSLIESDTHSDPGSKLIPGPHSKPIDVEDSKWAWEREYQGTAHKLLLRNIQVSYKDSPYANSGAIIQSSGYGKSRTVDEMAKLIPTIPMNVRAASDKKQGAFPPADPTLTEVFQKISASDKPVDRLFMFFKVLFKLVHDLVQGFEGEDVVMGLYRYFKNQDERVKFYADLSEILKQNPDDSTYLEATDSFDKLARLLPKSEDPIKLVIYVDEAHTLAPHNVGVSSMYDHMLKAAADLASIGVFWLFLSTASRLEILASQAKLASSSRLQTSEYLVSPFTEMPFDCHLSLVKKIQTDMKLGDIQKFSFAVQFGRPLFWAYYEGMLARKSPSVDQSLTFEHPSHVVNQSSTLGHPSPVVNQSSTLGHPSPVVNQSPTPGHISDDDHLRRDVRIQTSTLAMAQGKLVGNASLEMMPGEAGKLAILDTLLNLEYDPRRTHSHRLASTMVASHMRTVYNVPTSRAYMHTGYPSEPVLAEAALTFINSNSRRKKPASRSQTGQTDPVRPLISFYRDIDESTAGAIDKGERGENVGKMVLLLAYIAAVNKHSNPDHPHGRFWGEGCSLVDFLTELTSDKFCGDVLVSVPDNVQGGLPLEKVFEKSWVRFTHFARAADDSAMTSSMAWVAFIRGMAMIEWHSQELVDVNIPILLDKDKPITEANMSSILVQFKVRSTRSTHKKVAIREEKIKYFPPPNSRRDASMDASEDERKEYRTRPYISLVMELGLVTLSDSSKIPSKVVHLLDTVGTGSKPSASQSKRSTRGHKPKSSISNVHISASQHRTRPPSVDHIHPRYSLFYYGCSHKVYRCILPEEDITCQTLLQIPNVFNDRHEDRPIDPILQMKPFWNAGPNCFSWINEPYFDPQSQSDESQLDDDEVLIGEGDLMDVDEETDAMDES